MLTTTSPATTPNAPSRCLHTPTCPAASDPAAVTARVLVDHSEQGWELLCNGVIRFDDAGLPIVPRT